MMLPPKCFTSPVSGPIPQNVKDDKDAKLPLDDIGPEPCSPRTAAQVSPAHIQHAFSAPTVKTEKSGKHKERGRSLSDQEYENIFAAVIEHAIEEPQQVTNQGACERPVEVCKPSSPHQRTQQGPPSHRGPVFQQVANEVTPLPSEDEGGQVSVPVKTPPKLPQKKSASSAKKHKVTPRQLEFPKRVTSQDLGASRKVNRVAHPQRLPGSNKCTAERKHQKKVKKSRELMASHEVEQNGTWVQCSIKSCGKWRHLVDVHDPTHLPEIWTCDMNDDPSANNCDAAEVKIAPHEDLEEFVYTRYTEGSIVWARMAGYPWWPGMVEIDPDFQIYAECCEVPNVASHYHVVFLDSRVSRAWCCSEALRPYTGKETHIGSTKVKARDYEKLIRGAKVRADEALKLPLQERIKKFGFVSTFKGKWGQSKEDAAHEDESNTLKVKSPVPRKHGRSKTGLVEEEEMDFDGGLCGLSGAEVDQILDNAESIIEDAQEVLEGLLTQDDGEEYVTPQKAEKPKKKRKIKEDKSVSKKEKKALGTKKHHPTSGIGSAKLKKFRGPTLPPKKNAAARNLSLQQDATENDTKSGETKAVSEAVAGKQVIQVTVEMDNEVITMEVDPPEGTEANQKEQEPQETTEEKERGQVDTAKVQEALVQVVPQKELKAKKPPNLSRKSVFYTPKASHVTKNAVKVSPIGDSDEVVADTGKQMTHDDLELKLDGADSIKSGHMSDSDRDSQDFDFHLDVDEDGVKFAGGELALPDSDAESANFEE